MKVFSSLPQEMEDEALASFDTQGDQIALSSEHILSLPRGEQEIRRSELFYYVFGYAQAKGWTSAEIRMNPKPL